ncbi:MAG: CoB--CoM heterodisulfide reductase iron-sulfur subunit A family protein, partial [Actinobacteria bacterium]|nr:CoB--CoM heterodisulfide reductase iron-sulfur subunit A family protein [Actinomycetota bacterium]
PHLHEPTFRGASSEAGLNPFLCELANIREQCAWVHTDAASATDKACQIVAAGVEKVKRDDPLFPVEVPVTKRALVVGAGVAGIRAALDIANAGYEVTLVEREPAIGGNMARLAETFPTLDCSQCILTPLMVEVSRHPNVELLTYSEVEDVGGYVGNFKVRIRRKPRFVREDLCTGCDDCVPVCPASAPNEFDLNLSWRKAIYMPFPQAVPAVYTLDPALCVNANLESESGAYRVLACESCFQACGPRAIDYDMREEIVEREVGAIIVTTGYQPMRAEQATEYGYGRYPDVVDGLEFERLLSASGPTLGEIRRPSDGAVPKDVVFIQCVGSRDPRNGVPYCSRICCMYTAKHALLFKHKVPDGQAYVFYRDIRAAGKGYEEFVTRVMEEEHALYVRGRVSRVVAEDGKLRVFGADTLSGRPVEILADLVVLATALVPDGRGELARTLRVPTDAYGFLQEAHPKLRPAETLAAGVFIAGSAQAPKDIPDTVSQASAAASKALQMLSRPTLEREPTVAAVNEATCIGCFDCERVCPYGAIERREIRDRQGALVRLVAHVNTAVCEGCGACTTACRVRSVDVLGFDDEQVFAQLEALAPLPVEVPA